MIHQINCDERRVVCIVHPDATGIVDSPRFGGIRTERGEAGYIVSVSTKDPKTSFVHYRTERIAI